MIFNSIEFTVFFSVFFFLYWFIFQRSLRLQNVLLLVGSYFFYAWWDWRFLALIIAGSLINYWLGIAIHSTNDAVKRKRLLWLGVLYGLGGLLFFKYCNFFIESFVAAFTLLGVKMNASTLDIIVPLGISFYTFRTLSYLIDIRNGKSEPTKDWIAFFTYVSFFPTFISGPIDRARTFIPQMMQQRIFRYEEARLGMQQILWGLFKKLVIADNLSTITAYAFNGYEELPGSMLLIGAFSFAIEVYADFSGYSDMAIGFSRLLGFSVTKNFDFPYFAQNIADFWRKWHISLTSWLTEYVFTPLTIAFRDWGQWGIIAAIIINMMVCGFWHGANWTFIVFGLLQGLYFIPIILRGKLNKKKKMVKGQLLPTWKELLAMLSTFTLIAITDVLFRCDNITQAIGYYKHLFSPTLLSNPILSHSFILTLVLTLLFFVAEWIGREHDFALANVGFRWPRVLRWGYYSVLLFLIGMYMNTSETPFIYFKF